MRYHSKEAPNVNLASQILRGSKMKFYGFEKLNAKNNLVNYFQNLTYWIFL